MIFLGALLEVPPTFDALVKANNAAGDNYDVYIPCATLTPSGDLSLITEKDVASFELEFAVNKLSDNADLIVFTKRAA